MILCQTCDRKRERERRNKAARKTLGETHSECAIEPLIPIGRLRVSVSGSESKSKSERKEGSDGESEREREI